MNTLLFEIIMSNQCNRRCSYCKLDFFQQKMPQEHLDALSMFLERSENYISRSIINFFGWEPLLNQQGIRYFVEKTKHLPFVHYSIGTNGLLLNEDMFWFMRENNFEIYLSIDTEVADIILRKKFLQSYTHNIWLNFIVNPNTISQSPTLFERCLEFGFQNINIMPVMFTMRWTKPSFVQLKHFVDTSVKPRLWKYNIQLHSYYNGVTPDMQYILDSDGYIYSDLDSLLWIQKQWNILSKNLKEKIHNSTKIDMIADMDIDRLLRSYDMKNVIRLVNEIPREQWFLKEYAILSNIMNG